MAVELNAFQATTKVMDRMAAAPPADTLAGLTRQHAPPATRQGQREIAAASLAAGLMAASGKPTTVVEAVALMRKVAEEMDVA